MTWYTNSNTAEAITGTEGSDLFQHYFETYYELGVDDDDTLMGQGGTDEFTLTPGQDVIDGGEGYDIFTMTNQMYLDADKEGGLDTGRWATYTVSASLVDLQAGTYTATLHQIPDESNWEAPDVEVSGTLTSINKVNAYLGNDTLLGSTGGYYQSSRDMYREDFEPNGGSDVIDGRGGFNALRYDGVRLATETQGIVVNVAAGTVVDGLGGVDIFRDIQLFIGSYYSDVFNGDAGDQEFWGSGFGQDSFFGGGGTDLVYFDGVTVTGVMIDLATQSGINERGLP